MSKPTNALVRLGTLLVMLFFMGSSTALAQEFYVAPGENGGGGSAADPGSLGAAIAAVNSGSADTIVFESGNYIAGTDAPRSFELVNDVTFDGDSEATLVGFNVIQLGDVEPNRDNPFDDTAILVVLADGFDLELRGVAEVRFAFTDGNFDDGDDDGDDDDGDEGDNPNNDIPTRIIAGGDEGGRLIVSTNGTTNLAVDSAPGRIVVQRLVIDDGTVQVVDNQLEQFIGSVPASLHVFEQLSVIDGATLDLLTQDLYLTFDLGDDDFPAVNDPLWQIDDDSEITSNNGTVYLVIVDEDGTGDDDDEETFSTTGMGTLTANLNIPYSEAENEDDDDYDIFITFTEFGITSSVIGGAFDFDVDTDGDDDNDDSALRYFTLQGTGSDIDDDNSDGDTDPQVLFTNVTNIEGDLIVTGAETPDIDDDNADVFNFIEDVNDEGTAVGFSQGGTLDGRLLHKTGAINLFGPWMITEESTLTAGYLRLDASRLPNGVGGSTIFEEMVTAEADGGESEYLILLDNASSTGGAPVRFHNIEFQGDLDFEASPITAFNTSLTVFPEDPRADYAFNMTDTECPNPDVAPVNQGAFTGSTGFNVTNKVILSGDEDQELFFGTQWVVRVLEVAKTGGADVEIDDDSSEGIIIAAVGDDSDDDLNDRIVEEYEDGVADADSDASSFLNVYSTRFTTNGLLDLNGTGQVTLEWTAAEGRGLLLAGESDEAYMDINGDGELYPIRIRYEGDIPIFTGDELPGDASGRNDDDEIVSVQTLQIAMSIPDPTVTIGKDILVTRNLDLPRGQLAVGSASVVLENQTLLSIGDGNIVPSAGFPVNGRLVFPDDPEFESIAGFPAAFIDGGNFDVSEDGIDLYFYPSMDRVVQLEYPSGVNAVVRDVTVNTPASVSLRREDARLFQVNRDVCVADGIFDIEDNTYIINAVNGVDTQVYVDTNGNLTDDFWTGDSAGSKMLRDRLALAGLKSAALAAEGDGANALAAKVMDAVADLKANTVTTAAKTQQDDDMGVFGAFGAMYFTGTELTEVIVETEDNLTDLTRTLPAQEINRTGNDDDLSDASVTYDSDSNVLLSSGDTLTPLDILEIPRMRIFDANDGESSFSEEGVGVLLCTGLDILNIYGDFYQEMGEFAAATCDTFDETETVKGFPAGVTDFLPANEGYWYQRIEVGLDNDMSAGQMGNYTVLDGEWYGNGSDLYVFNTSQIGVVGEASTAYWDGSPYTWHYSLGDFYVGMDEEPGPGLYLGAPCRTSRDQAETCGSDADENNRGVRNSYVQGGFNDGLPVPDDLNEDGATSFTGPGVLWMSGANYTFLGTGDRFQDAFVEGPEQGLDGLVAFVGNLEQVVMQRQDEDAFFNNVLVQGDPGVFISGITETDAAFGGMWVNDYGTVNLQLGNINAPADAVPGGDPEVELIVLNPSFEEGFVGRFSARNEYGSGFADGARDSYVSQNTPIRRVVAADEDNATGGDVTDAYYFPHGAFRSNIPGLPQGREFFLPLLLEFNQDQGEGVFAKSTIVAQDDVELLTALQDEFSPVRVDAAGASFTFNGAVDQDGLLLNELAPVFYRVEFFGGGDFTADAVRDEADIQGPNDDIPSEDPNIRLSVDGLVFSDVTRIRVVHYSCDDTDGDGDEDLEFLGLAGVYDLFADDVDDTSVNNNDIINGVPQLIQEGVNVRQCNIFAVAANGFENPVGSPLGSGGGNENSGRVQIVHDSPDAPAVDIYIDGDLATTLEFDVDGDEIPKATPFGTMIAGAKEVAVVPAGGALGDAVFTTTLNVQRGENYIVFASGLLSDGSFTLDVVDNAVVAAEDEDELEIAFQHNAPNAPSPVDVQLLDAFNNNLPFELLANNLGYLENSDYEELEPDDYTIAVTTADGATQAGAFYFALDGYDGQALMCFATNTDVGSKQDALGVLCVDRNGTIIVPDVGTDVEGDVELPTEFALQGNYPNPFNPSTTIQFDLPETAEVSLEVVDMLGRRVMTLPTQTVQAGANRTLEVNASALASGVYVYRLVVKTANGQPEFRTGRMTLVK